MEAHALLYYFFPSSKVHKKRCGAEEDVTARNNTSFSRAFFPSLLGKMPFLEFEKEEEMAYWHLTYSAQREGKIRDKCCGNPDCVFGKWGEWMRGQFGTFFSHKTVWLKPHSIVRREGESSLAPDAVLLPNPGPRMQFMLFCPPHISLSGPPSKPDHHHLCERDAKLFSSF